MVEDTYPHVLEIGKKLPHLEKASRFYHTTLYMYIYVYMYIYIYDYLTPTKHNFCRLSLDTLRSDLNDLKKKLTSVGWSLEEAQEDLKQQMADFVEVRNKNRVLLKYPMFMEVIAIDLTCSAQHT